MSTTDSIIIQRILTSVAEYKASDLHISVGNPPALRVNGEVHVLDSENIITEVFAQTFVQMILNDNQKKELEVKRELVTSWSFEDKMRFRVHIFYQDGFPSISFRFISDRIPTLDQLAIPNELYRILQMKSGLVVFNGPAGSGKTTTLASFIDNINKEQAKRIVTLEEPIEYFFHDSQSIIDQREVGRDVVSFEDGLRTFLRDDVDIFYVNKFQDSSVVESVLRLTSAGHLVFVVMDSASTVSSLQQIVNYFHEEAQNSIRQQLATDLSAIVTQRLVQKVGGGQVPAFEVLFPTSAVRSIIRDGEMHQIQNILQTSRGEGMISLDKSLSNLASQGVVSEEDAFMHALDKNQFRLMMR